MSGKTAENLAGFQRLMAKSVNHVGIVLGLELSRLSRSNKDWHQLVDVCGIFNTLMCDQDGVYDAGDGNDRLLLGMKGAMSEFELVTLRNRLLRGTRNKAERGEHFTLVPVGIFQGAARTGDSGSRRASASHGSAGLRKVRRTADGVRRVPPLHHP
jgi:DNA invertase Pin-like site-specific DNA recombinase